MDASEWTTVRVEIASRVAWVYLNRPDKRNAMSPTLNREMIEVLDVLDGDDDVGVVVLTGTGESFSAGMDLNEYFRETDSKPPSVQRRVREEAMAWQWRKLRLFDKPTIAMVNGWCFGGAFTPLIACDLAIAADEATFGLSEVNWGIPPGGNVSRALAECVGSRNALFYIMTGRPFDGRRAAEIGLVNASVPLAELREEVERLASELLEKSPTILSAAKHGFKQASTMDWAQAEDYLYAKLDQSRLLDPEEARAKGLGEFLDQKSFRPGLGTVRDE